MAVSPPLAADGMAAAGAPPPGRLDPLALADFEAGLDGLAENDLVDEAEVDSIIRETVLHTIGENPWADSKVRAPAGGPKVGRASRCCPLQRGSQHVHPRATCLASPQSCTTLSHAGACGFSSTCQLQGAPTQ